MRIIRAKGETSLADFRRHMCTIWGMLCSMDMMPAAQPNARIHSHIAHIYTDNRLHSMLKFIWCLLLSLPAHAFDYSWRRLHEAASPEELQRTVEDYRSSFPCEECRGDFDAMVEAHPFPIEEVNTVEEARIWSWLTHNMVNRKLEKDWQSFEIMYKYK